MWQRLRRNAYVWALFAAEPDDNESHSLMQMRMIGIDATANPHAKCPTGPHAAAKANVCLQVTRVNPGAPGRLQRALYAQWSTTKGRMDRKEWPILQFCRSQLLVATSWGQDCGMNCLVTEE